MTDAHDTVPFDAVRVPYNRGLRWFFVLVPLLLGGVAAAAWRETDAGGGPQWLVFVVGLPLVAGWVWHRTRDAAVTVTTGGRIRRRSVTGDQSADLTRLVRVSTAPTLAHPDTLAADRSPDYGYVLHDAAGSRVTIAAGRPWVGVGPALVQVVRAIEAGHGRTDPRAWAVLQADAGLGTHPLPAGLTAPPEARWGEPLAVDRHVRASALTPYFALSAIPMVPSLTGFFEMVSTHLGRALTSLAGGVIVTGVLWILLWLVLRRGDRDVVRVTQDGRLHSVSHRTGAFLLGWRVVAGSVDLHRLVRCQVVPVGRVHANHRDRPGAWRLELADEEGGTAEVVLHHVRTPPATLLPQLAHHLERHPLALDDLTRRALELRLGRPLELASPTPG